MTFGRLGSAADGAPPPRSLSKLLDEIGARPEPRVALGEVTAELWDRGFAPLMVICALPNVLPILPGSSFFFGIPLILVSWQLLLGRARVWLPRFAETRSVERAAWRSGMARARPWLQWLERLARPRFWPASRRLAERIAGAASLVMSIFLFLPIPFANTMPALSIILIALGVSERDGVWLGAGLALSAVSSAIVAGIYLAGAAALAYF